VAPEAESQGPKLVPAARERSRQQGTLKKANGRYTHELLTAEALEERIVISEILEKREVITETHVFGVPPLDEGSLIPDPHDTEKDRSEE
jgi:hypothetical protein